jgi:putative nucleotidyltransferase with HDIG domain
MRSSESRTAGALSALSEGVSVALPAPPQAGALSEELFRRSRDGGGRQARHSLGGAAADRREPGRLKSPKLSLSIRSLWLSAAIAAAVLAIAAALVYELVSVADDPQLAREIGWNLLVIGLSAGGLAAGATWWLVRRITRALTASLEESLHARERSYVEAVGAVVTAADARDHETTGHSFRVALYAAALAKAMGVHGEELKAIEWGALLHDVGKMVVPDEILRKVGPLTAGEWHIMKQHPSWGFDMLAEVSFLQPAVLDIIYCHHEHWNGGGYPRGLAAESIPLSARIFAVVDTYDAITSDRPYRRARSHQTAVAELQRVAGEQLDPRIVEAFCGISEIELRRLRELCKRVHPGLSLPQDLLDSLAEPEAETRADFGS